jgi:HrpA-like RNA helicase
MSGPPLLRPGGLIANKWSAPQAELDKYVPVKYIMDWFKSKIKQNTSPADRILILRSATGSGKSSTFPAELYYTFYDDIKRGIACLQPTVVNTIQVPVDSVIPLYQKEHLKKYGYASKEPMELGVNIGYQTGTFATQPVKGLTYMTTGTLAQQLAIMPDADFMNKYAFIIVDEAHNRSIETDMVIYTLKKFVERNFKNPLCPFVIITSATFDPIHFCNYMLSSIKVPTRYQNIIDVRGATFFPITETFLDYDAKDYIKSTIDTVAKIHVDFAEDFLGPKSSTETLTDNQNEKPKKTALKEDQEAEFKKLTYYRDILIFVAGNADAVAIKKGLDQLNSDHEFFKKYPVLVLKLSSKEVGEKSTDFISIFERNIEDLHVEVHEKGKVTIKQPTRRVMISTPAGETGLTFSALKHVIDTGFRKVAEYNPTFGIEGLVLQPITKGIHIQRKGRVGRRSPGFSYPMFTEATYNKLRADNLPDMLLREMSLQILKMIIMMTDPKNTVNENIPKVLFSSKQQYINMLRYEQRDKRNILAEQVKNATINVSKFDLLDLPSADSLHESIEKLYVLGAINSNMVPTPLGFIMNKFRYIPIESIKMILSGYAWEASISDLVTIAAFMDFHSDLRPRKLEKKRVKAAEQNLLRLGIDEEAAKHIEGFSQLYQSILIADDFISNLILYFDFQKHVIATFTHGNVQSTDKNHYQNGGDTVGSEKLPQSEFETMNAWCVARGVDYNTIIEAIDRRDEVVNTLAAIGFNPFLNEKNSLLHVVNTYQNGTIEELITCVKRLKQCIYDGYKLNIAEWNPKVKAYISHQTHMFLPFFNPLFIGKRDIDKYGDGNPRFIIYNKITLKRNQETGVYSPEVNGISVLDGFVSIDQQAT